MVAGLTLLTAPLWTVVLVGTILFLLTARQYGEKGSYPLMAVFGGAVIWAGAYAVELEFSSAIAYNLRFLGATFVPLGILAIALQFTDNDEYLTVRNIALASVVPVLNNVLVWTNPAHGLWADPATIPAAAPGDVQHGIAFYLGSLYLLGIAGAAIALLGKQALEQEAETALNTVAIFLFATLLPTIAYMVYAIGLSPLDLSPFTFLVSGVLMMFAMFYL